jgi:cation-transporting P-type ATPase J
MPPLKLGTRPQAVGVRPALRLSRTAVFSLPEVRWATTATVLFLIGLIVQFSSGPAWLWWSLYLACYCTGGWQSAWAGIEALGRKTLDIDLLMVVAAIGAAAIGQVLDGGLLIVIFAASGALEALATRRTADSVRGLLDLAPEQAIRLTPDGDDEQIDAAALVVGDEILVRPGERIGGDGDIVDGTSDVDEATITGESLPVAKGVGDEVFAGTLNGTGVLRVRITQAASETVVARIVAMVAEASATKAETQLFIERVEQRYSVGVVAATLALFLGPLAFGAAVQPTLLRAMTFMIVASPCAMVLATMPPLLAAIANAGRHGVLVKSAVVMERLREISVVAFDKTGTLTAGAPRLTHVHAIAGTGRDEDAVLRLAASVEASSEHPLGRAIVAAGHQRLLHLARVEEFRAVPGCGVTANVEGHVVAVSSPVHGALGAPPDSADMRAAAMVVTELEADGHTVVVVTVDDQPIGVLGLADQLRPGAATVVAAVRSLTGRPPVLLTGDNRQAAVHVARETGIGDVHAGLLPKDKVTAVRALESEGARVLLVGDGVNDAPALAAAHTGIAMGRNGSDLALDTADAVVVRDDLATIPALVALSRHAHRVVVANLAIAATFVTVLVLWDLFGHLPLPLGVAGHEGSTIIVGLNGLRLLRDKAWPTTKPANA